MLQPFADDFMSVDDKFVKWQRRLKADRSSREQTAEINQDGAVDWETNGMLRLPSIL